VAVEVAEVARLFSNGARVNGDVFVETLGVGV
jgi:hypothetical protein